MEIIVDPTGQARCVYCEDIDLTTIGEVDVSRASHVEPDSVGRWWADLSPVTGPKLCRGARQNRPAWGAQNRPVC
jgi:hypothetical protein